MRRAGDTTEPAQLRVIEGDRSTTVNLPGTERDETAPFNSVQHHRILEALPVAIYTTDAAGRITFFNNAAVAMWGCRPELGKSEFCGSWKLFWPDGTPLPHDQCPMAIALREKRAGARGRGGRGAPRRHPRAVRALSDASLR